MGNLKSKGETRNWVVGELSDDELYEEGEEKREVILERSDAMMREHNLRVPVNVLEVIMSYLSGADVMRCCCTCKSWRRVASNDRVWITKGFESKQQFIETCRKSRPYIPKYIRESGVWRKNKKKGEMHVYLTSPLDDQGGAEGKTSLIFAALGYTFSEEYDPTIEGTYQKVVNIEQQQKNKLVSLEITDTAGQPEFLALHTTYVAPSDVAIICSTFQKLSDAASVDQAIQRIRKKREKLSLKHLPIIIVATKIDIVSSVVPLKTIKRLVDFSQPCIFIPTSSKSKINVDLLFKWAGRLTFL